MPGFTANPPAPDSDTIVAGDGWWPGLSIATLRDQVRLPRDLSDLRVRDAISTAMIDVSTQLDAWKTCQVAAGAESLEAIAAPQFAGESQLVLLWRRAVFATAAADLADTSNDISATEGGRQRSEIRATAADEHRRNATAAVRAIKGRRRNRSRLV